MTAFQPIVRTSNNWLHLASAADYTGASRAELAQAIEPGELDALLVDDRDPSDLMVRMHDVEAWVDRRHRVAV